MFTAILFYAFFVAILIKILTRLTVGRCKSYTSLVGKTALITGGNSGIGLETALGLASRGCRVIIADKDDCALSKERIIKETDNNNIITKRFDLSSLKSVRELAKNILETEERLDILINNAGAGGLGNQLTEDGLHIGMQVNHFGSFLLTHLLKDLLVQSAPSRIIFVSSILSFVNNLTPNTLNPVNKSKATALSHLLVYGNSKLCSLITTYKFAKVLQSKGVTCNAVYPGFVDTPIFERTFHSKVLAIPVKLLLLIAGKSAEEGAQTSLHLATSKDVKDVTGRFFTDCRKFYVPNKALDKELCRKIWDMSVECVKLGPEEKLIG